MIGFTHFRPLQLTKLQHVAVICNIILCLLSYYTLSPYYWICGFICIWGMFIHKLVIFDSELLFRACRNIHQLPSFQTTYMHETYVRYQPPFYTWFVSRYPNIIFHQVLLCCLSLLCAWLLYMMHGPIMYLIYATPLYAIMQTQPSNDMIAFFLIILAKYTIYVNVIPIGAVLFGLSLLIKYTGVAVLWYYIYYMSYWSIIPCIMVVYYVYRIHNTFIGNTQRRFYKTYVHMNHRHKKKPYYIKVLKTIRRRWNKYGYNVFLALWYYLFPYYVIGLPFANIVLILIIYSIFPNVKYFILLFTLL